MANFDGTHILLFPTFRCNYRCSYCVFHQDSTGCLKTITGSEWHIGPELSAAEWKQHLDKFKPYLLEMSGGEPTLSEAIPELVNDLPDGCKWAITSNGTYLPDYNERAAKTCGSYTLSFHLEYFKKGGKQYLTDLVGKAVELKKQGFPVAFTFVITPELLPMAEAVVPILQKDWPVNIHPAAFVVGLNWDKHRDELRRIKKLGGMYYIEYPMSLADCMQFESCTAGGRSYFFLMPDGRVLRCHSQVFSQHHQELGHISTWQLPETDEFIPCEWPHMVACDDRSTKKRGK